MSIPFIFLKKKTLPTSVALLPQYSFQFAQILNVTCTQLSSVSFVVPPKNFHFRFVFISSISFRKFIFVVTVNRFLYASVWSTLFLIFHFLSWNILKFKSKWHVRKSKVHGTEKKKIVFFCFFSYSKPIFIRPNYNRNQKTNFIHFSLTQTVAAPLGLSSNVMHSVYRCSLLLLLNNNKTFTKLCCKLKKMKKKIFFLNFLFLQFGFFRFSFTVTYSVVIFAFISSCKLAMQPIHSFLFMLVTMKRWRFFSFVKNLQCKTIIWTLRQLKNRNFVLHSRFVSVLFPALCALFFSLSKNQSFKCKNIFSITAIINFYFVFFRSLLFCFYCEFNYRYFCRFLHQTSTAGTGNTSRTETVTLKSSESFEEQNKNLHFNFRSEFCHSLICVHLNIDFFSVRFSFLRFKKKDNICTFSISREEIRLLTILIPFFRVSIFMLSIYIYI